MGFFSPLPDELTLASDTSNAVSIIGELCLKPFMNIVRVHIFVKKTLNDHSSLAPHPAVNNPNV
jgi:hypothetical protein